jgi:alpha-beta hydrolase superfamily lysophospholipase
MKGLLKGAIKYAIRASLYSSLGAFVVLVAVFAIYLDSRPDLKVWHLADLDAEFTEDSPVADFPAYLALEERLFAQLDAKVLAKVEAADRNLINRYHRGSLSDPGRWPRNWNHSFELSSEKPLAGILMLHGMSDSPYSLRSLGERLQAAGAWVVGLRVPGHGTAPSGLVEVRWQDMAAAVRLAMRHLSASAGGRPLYIVGYSNGGALAVEYALSTLEDSELPRAEGLVLISPAIGVTPAAALAVWQARLGHLLGLEKLAWNSILPEYDPYKYGSFAVNAGDQVYRLTREIRGRLERLGQSGELARFPPVLAFQSVVDATVSAPALVDGLFGKLPPGGHELVLFDVNRVTDVEPLLSSDPAAEIEAMLRDRDLTFTLSFLANETEDSVQLVLHQKRAGETAIGASPTGLFWPEGIYSLSHVALPFPPADPLYGGDESEQSPGLRLGNLALRGERGTLRLAASDMLRLRWNPFYSYLESRLLQFIGLGSDS